LPPDHVPPSRRAGGCTFQHIQDAINHVLAYESNRFGSGTPDFGDPFIAVAATPTDIGAHELQSLGDVIFAGDFGRRREISVRAPGPDLSWRLSFPDAPYAALIAS
jgi:hypothetical protein